MRPRSIIGPLLLILVGALFLVNNLHPELPWIDLVSKYWPYLLIAWGVLRLIEVLVWWFLDKPVDRGVSGGEWAAVTFIVLIGTGLFVTQRWWPQGPWMRGRGIEMFGETYDYPLNAEQAAGKTPQILVENLRGNARIVGTSEDKVKVTGRKTIRAMSKEEADAADRQTPLEVSVQGDRVTVRTNQERATGPQRVSMEIEIAVPRGAAVETRGRYGDFDISDIAGEVKVSSDNAGVRLQNLGGQARVELRRSDIVRAVNVKGGVEVSVKGRGEDVELDSIEGPVVVTGTYTGDLQFRKLAKPLRFSSHATEFQVAKVPGQIHITPGEIRGNNMAGPVRLDARSRGRDIELVDFTQAAEVTLDRGNIDLRPSKGEMGKIVARTNTGDIDLSIPGGAGFTIEAATRRGEVQNDFGSPLTAQSGHDGGSLKGSVGQGPAIKLTTDRGSITVRKAVEHVKSEAKAGPAPVKVQVDRQ
jgi:DUF4097 and DUF4098 domain-containing protein YvlB